MSLTHLPLMLVIVKVKLFTYLDNVTCKWLRNHLQREVKVAFYGDVDSPCGNPKRLNRRHLRLKLTAICICILLIHHSRDI